MWLSLEGIILYVVLLWKLVQTFREPHDRSLRLVTACLLAGAAAYPFEVMIGEPVRSQVASGPIAMIWAHELFVLLLVYLLICFFLFSSSDLPDARNRAWRHGGVLLSVLSAITVASAVALSKGTPEHYPLATVSVLFLVSDAYTAYGFSIALVWVRRYARRGTRRLRHGLAVASFGLALMMLATIILMSIVTLRWATGKAPQALVSTQGALLAPGIVAFIFGVSYPGAAMRMIATRVWVEHLISYYRLRSLWKDLHAVFPEDSFPRTRVANWLKDVTFRSVHRRYYRRIIEIRDGLVRISPYMASVREQKGEDVPVGDQFRTALKWYREGREPSLTVTTIAPPKEVGISADVEALIKLSKKTKLNGQV